MTPLEALWLASGLAFSLFLLWLLVGVEHSRREEPSGVVASPPAVAVVVAARNEEEGIDACLDALAAQDVAVPLEVIIVDDRSTDATAARVRARMDDWPSPGTLRLVEAPVPARFAGPKKNALAAGIAATDATILLLTDADCRPPAAWARHLLAPFADDTVGLVAGYADRLTAGLIGGALRLDDLGMGALAEGGIGHGVALSCTGRSLAYRRQVYDEVGGFAAIGHLVAGDDVYFQRLVAARTPWAMRYCADEAAVVTDGRLDRGLVETVRRKWRHASKASRYDGGARWLGLFIYFYHGLLGWGLIDWALAGTPNPWFLGTWAARWGLDGTLLWRFAPRRQDRRALAHLPLVEFLYIPYVLLFVPLSRLFGFRWRDAPASG